MSKKLAYVDNGHQGQPGSGYSKNVARIDLIRTGRVQMLIVVAWGSNQGYLEEHGRIERRYRAGTLDELMRISIAEVRADAEIDPDTAARLVAAIREATFAAEDEDAAK